MRIKSLNEQILNIQSNHDYNRVDLPQIPQARIHDFLTSLDRSHIAWSIISVKVGLLKPTQTELNTDKIKEQSKRGIAELSKQFWVISNDYHILDGHHRWAGLIKLDPETMVQCYIINVPIPKLISLGHNFLGSFTKGINQ
jgi:hypothetical protein